MLDLQNRQTIYCLGIWVKLGLHLLLQYKLQLIFRSEIILKTYSLSTLELSIWSLYSPSTNLKYIIITKNNLIQLTTQQSLSMMNNKWSVPLGAQLQIQKKSSCFTSIGNTLKKFNPCLRPQKQLPLLSKYLQQFQQVSLYDDPYFGEVFLLQSLTQSQNQQILLKKQRVNLDEEEKRQAQIRQLENFNKNPHIISQTLIGKILKTQFLWTKIEFYLAYDYIVFDLQKQFQYRLAKGIRFSDRQVMSIIRGACKGFTYLQSTSYSSIRMSYIYFTRKGLVKIAHPNLFRYKSNLQNICQYDASKGIYLSPQQMFCVEKGEKDTILGWKSNYYVFGMVLLSLMSQSHLNEIYNYSGCFIDRLKIDQLLRNCKQYYPEKLVNYVEKLIQDRPEQRMTFRTLLNKVSNNIDSHNHQIQLELLNEKGKPVDIQTLPLDQPYASYKEPQHVNYIAGLIYPKIATTGEIYNEKKIQPYLYSDHKYNNNQQLVVAEQRHFYSNRNSFYMGDAKSTIGDKFNEKQMREGKGYYLNQDGQYFVGNWQKGDMTGYGKLYWSENKIRYEGDFLNGKFHGRGVQYNADPKTVGITEPGDEPDHTFVRLQRNNWQKYEGSFIDDKRQGQGIVYFKSGKWMGNFRNSQPNGQGIFIDNNGIPTKGLWRDGVRI